MAARSWKLWVLVIAVIGVATLLVVRERRGSDSQAIRIGVILSLSGPADFIGQPEGDILRAMVQQFNADEHAGPRIDLVIEDSGGEVERALSMFQRFSRDTSIVAVIGPSTSGESVALAREARTSRLPLLSLAASRDIVLDENGRTNEWAFKFAQNDNLAAERILQAMVTRNDTTVALLYSNDAFGKSGAKVFKEAADSSRMVRIVHEFAFQPALTQPEPIASRIPSSADAILIWGTAPGPALVLKAIKGQRNPAQIYLSHGNASSDFVSSVGPASEGSIVVGSRVLLAQRYLNDQDAADVVVLNYNAFWQQNLKGTPSHFAGHARDALYALVRAFDAGARNRQAVRDQLESMRNFPGVTGVFNFSPDDHAGLDGRSFETYVISQGAFVPLAGAP